METKPEYVYCIKNEAMPNICKCGGTAKSPEKRCKQISNTSLPLECQIAYYIEVTNWKKAEKFIHNKIVESGIKRYKSREWFDCKPEFIKNIFDECKKLYGYVKVDVVEDELKGEIDSDKVGGQLIEEDDDNNPKIKSYNCTLCNYITEDSGNFAHHKKSKKHISNINEIKLKEYDVLKKKNDELNLKVSYLDKIIIELNNKLLEKEIEIIKSKYNNNK